MMLERILALAAAAVVATALGVGLMMMALSPPPPAHGALSAIPSPPAKPPSPRQAVEATIASAPEYAHFFARLREKFPQDYEGTISGFASRLSETKTDQGADYYLSEAMRRLRQSRGALAAKSEPESMSRVFAKQLAVLQAIAREDKKLCVAFLYGANNSDFQRFAASRRPLVADMASASLEAMVDGQAKNIAREQPTEADFKALETALAARGLAKPEIDALLDGKMPDPPLEDAKMCVAGQTYLEVLRTLPEAPRTRIYGLALELMARS